MKAIFDGIIGHSAQTVYLSTVLEKQGVSHAYCFGGAESLGKTAIAERFAAGILDVAVDDLRTHPDFIQIDLPIDEKTEEQKSTIPVESIRDLRKQLQLSSFSDGMRIAIIRHAGKMTISAQNALLKTLEEPRANTMIILIVESPESLLPTILSRSVLLRFYRVSRETICSTLRDQGVLQDEAHEIAGLAGGRPGVSVRLRDKSAREDVIERYNEIEQFLQGSAAERIKLSEKMVKACSRQELHQKIELLEYVLHDQLLASTGNSGWAARHSENNEDAVGIARKLDAALDAHRALHRNQSQNLLLERVILQA